MTPRSSTTRRIHNELSLKRRARWIVATLLIAHHYSYPMTTQLSSSTTSAFALALGPIRVWPGRNSFCWEADVDCESGIASSREIMHSSPKSSIAKHFRGKSSSSSTSSLDPSRFSSHLSSPSPLPTTSAGVQMSMSSSSLPSPASSAVHDVWTDVTKRLEEYPQWLVRGAVTWGLFHAVPIPGGGFSLQDRFLGINFLIFGRPHASRFSFLKTVTSKHNARLQTREGDATVTLPIIGGVLALKNGYGDRGCLWFRLQHNEALQETKMITEIRGYHPFLIGDKLPIPFFRKMIYLSTQSVIHAYVMWRFQRHCLHTPYKPTPTEASLPMDGGSTAVSRYTN
ncbi:expressed unknown protein [Seminavis robusta]|uniref:Uncharacterized protein n=1 Tax=Seminavis robusta TaxID=568900 RepID=A0A9N8DX89_9STRA|nr:expressed unknown protein [Seminavis robusta]|eukprot:Sro424_g139870.1 n/a (341) ;mRNA; r:9935-10957